MMMDDDDDASCIVQYMGDTNVTHDYVRVVNLRTYSMRYSSLPSTYVRTSVVYVYSTECLRTYHR